MTDESKCPLCGSTGALALISFECSNDHCQNYHPSSKPEKAETSNDEDEWSDHHDEWINLSLGGGMFP